MFGLITAAARYHTRLGNERLENDLEFNQLSVENGGN
jgi:hypothetical protein